MNQIEFDEYFWIFLENESLLKHSPLKAKNKRNLLSVCFTNYTPWKKIPAFQD